MKKLMNDPKEFVPEMMKGIEAANPGTIKWVPEYNLIMRADAPNPDKVSIVQGSGSGHEPAHIMIVGKGMLDAACPGDVFAAPPMGNVVESSKIMDSPKGILHIVNNYTGDRMSFETAVEMLEAVGRAHHETFFKVCEQRLKPDGMMLLQAITIADQRYAGALKSVDFIQRYIFPGGCLTSVTAMTDTLTRVSDMRVFHIEDIGPHYATTLRHWHDRFMARLDEVFELGYSESFARMWQFYLAYCESAFLERATDNVHMLMMRPDARRDSIRY